MDAVLFAQRTRCLSHDGVLSKDKLSYNRETHDLTSKPKLQEEERTSIIKTRDFSKNRRATNPLYQAEPLPQSPQH